MNINWFKDVRTLDELRKMYRNLAKTHHPDRGGDVESMKEINNQYEKLSKTIINENPTFTEERKAAEHQHSADIAAKLNEIITIENIEIEIIGNWIWLTGNTYMARVKIKAAGFLYSKNKSAWFWHEDGYRKKNRKTYDLDDIRDFFGSEKVNNSINKSYSIA